MANLTPDPIWEDVYQIEPTDRVLGGPGGISNLQAQSLANQSLYIRKHGGALPYLSTIAYDVGDRVRLSNGDEVVSEVSNNTNDPNTNRVGWGPSSRFISKLYLSLDNLVPSTDGSIDCAAAINAALQKYAYWGAELVGNPSSTYLIRDTIDFRGKNNITLNFNYATLLDDVQGTIPESGGRGKHTFLLYDCHDVLIKKTTYNIAPTRTNTSTSSIPTIVFWCGGQYLNPAANPTVFTTSVTVEDFNADGHSIDQGMCVAGLGELKGLKLNRFNLKNGNWMFGCNFEYGLRPVDLEVDKTLNNGRHPYDIEVTSFNGENLPKCVGFLRTASCYNVKFSRCTGFNVPNFIYYYSGDRGISRYSQNVLFEQCKSKLDDTVTIAQYAVQIIVTSRDGSTGEPLEEWVNRDHMIRFSQCEFIGNYVQFTSALRYFGNNGKTIFEGCTFKRYYQGLWAQYTAQTNPNVPSPYTLSFRDCIWDKNWIDVYQVDTQGVLYDHCTFKRRVTNSSGKNQITLDSILSDCSGTVFRDCYMAEQPSSLIFIDNKSDGVVFERNKFSLFDANAVAITSTKTMYGSGNICPTGLLTSDSENFNRVIGDVRKMKIYTDSQNNDSVYFNVANLWFVNSTQTINQIIGGQVGDVVEFMGGVVASSATFVHSSGSATTATRLLNKSAANDNLTGSVWTRRYVKTTSGWRES